MRLVEGIADVDDPGKFVDRLAEIADEHGSTLQAFDAQYVVGRDHLERAVELADRAIDRDENVARNRAVEILLYAAGRRQIDRALELGVDVGRGPAVILVDGGDETAAAGTVATLLDPAETLGDYDPERVREFFDVSRTELATVEGDLGDVVLERVALLDVAK